jgi:hypothetical protein
LILLTAFSISSISSLKFVLEISLFAITAKCPIFPLNKFLILLFILFLINAFLETFLETIGDILSSFDGEK